MATKPKRTAKRIGARLHLPKYCNGEMLLLEHFQDAALVARTYSTEGDYLVIDILGCYDPDTNEVFTLTSRQWYKLIDYINANI